MNAVCPQRSDAELVQAFRDEADEDAFRVLLDRYESRLLFLLHRLLRNTDDAADVFQRTWMNVVEKVDDFDTQRPFQPWLFRIATNAAVDLLRKRKRRPTRFSELADDASPFDSSDDASPDPLQNLSAEESKEIVRRAMKQLWSQHPKHYMLLMLRDYAESSRGEIAEVLGIAVGTVDSRLHTARERLREQVVELGAVSIRKGGSR